MDSSPSLDTTENTHQMDQDTMSTRLNDQQGPGKADLSALSILDDHLPVLTTTKVHSRGKDFEMPTMTAQYFETTDSTYPTNSFAEESIIEHDLNTILLRFLVITLATGLNDAYVLNTGFSVWALDWCPLPSFNGGEGENWSYVAVGGFPDTAENCNARDQLYPLGKQDAHPNIIQIWTMNCNTNDEGELQGDPHASLDICILHSYGAVFDLKWCPTGGYMKTVSTTALYSKDLTRLTQINSTHFLLTVCGVGNVLLCRAQLQET